MAKRKPAVDANPVASALLKLTTERSDPTAIYNSFVKHMGGDEAIGEFVASLCKKDIPPTAKTRLVEAMLSYGVKLGEAGRARDILDAKELPDIMQMIGMSAKEQAMVMQTIALATGVKDGRAGAVPE